MYSVLIVDDEPVIKKGLQCFVNWESLDCVIAGLVSNGFEAKEFLLNNNIDIVITDVKMPGMDGIKLSEYIYNNHPHIKVIVLTAYTDFFYAQSAIKYGVVDFIIKNNPSEKIPEAVNKAKELIINQKTNQEKLKALETIISNNLTEMQDKFFKEVLNGILVDLGTITDKADEYNINLQNYFILVFEIYGINEEYNKNEAEESNKFILSMKEFISLTFKDFNHYTIVMTQNKLTSIVSFESKKDSSSYHTQSLLMTCHKILEMVDNFMKFNICIGISKVHSELNEIPTAYYEANKAITLNFYSENNISIYHAISDIDCNQLVTDDYKYIDDILNSLQSGDLESAVTSLKKLFEEYNINKEPIERVKVSSTVLCSLCFRLLANYKLDLPKNTGEDIEIYKHIQQSKSLQILFGMLKKTINTISNVINENEKQYCNLIKKVNLFIQCNYNKNIDLHTLAEHIHVNKSYLSRLYKKETGESLIDTLNKYRISQAKKLLKQTHKKISEIAIEVGIDDPAYFTHVFKKYTGISPMDYKGIN